MLKKITFYAALTVCTLANATINLDFDLNINEASINYQRHVQGTVVLENEESVLFETNELILEFTASENDDKGITVDCAVIRLEDEATDNNDEDDNVFATLLAQPKVRACWNQPESVMLGNEEGDVLEFTVNANQNSNIN